MVKILLIDDDELLREGLSRALGSAGYEVEEAGNGLDGLRAFRARGADVVITDLVMPEREGIETIVELHRDFPTVPIIAISGGLRSGSLDVLHVAGLLGATATIAKPFEIGELLAAVDRAAGDRTAVARRGLG